MCQFGVVFAIQNGFIGLLQPLAGQRASGHRATIGLGDFYTCIDLYIDFFAEIYEYPAGKPGRH